MAKYYAVRVGREPGIYRTWAECKAVTHCFQQAKFKSFQTEAEARAYLAGEVVQEEFDFYRKVPPARKKREAPRTTNPNNLYSFYSGDMPPWEFPTFIECYEDDASLI